MKQNPDDDPTRLHCQDPGREHSLNTIPINEAVQLIEQKFHILFEHASDSILLLEIPPDGVPVIRNANTATYRILGFDRDELIGRPISVLFSEPTPLELIEGRRRRMLDMQGSVFETRHRSKDGRVLDFECSVTEFQIGSKTLGISVEREITVRKRAEEALRIQHELSLALGSTDEINDALEHILDAALSMHDIDCGGIYVANRDGSLELAVHRGLSQGFIERCCRYPAGAPQAIWARAGKTQYESFRDIIPGSEQLHVSEGLRGIAVIPVLYKGQLLATLNLASHACSDIPGDTRNALETLAQQIGSILMRLNSATELRESRRNLRTLFDTVDDFLFVLDENGRILQTNSVVQNRLGYTAEELASMHVLTVHPPGRREEAEAIIGDMLAGRRVLCPIPIMAKDGTLIPVETRVTRGSWGGRPALFGLSRDVTAQKRAEEERKRLETELQQAMKMEAIGRLAGGVAHDFNNLLTGIMGNVYMALQDLDPADPLHEPLKEVEKAAESAASLTKQLLVFSRKQIVNPRTVNINSAVAEMNKMLLRLIGENINLKVSLADGLWAVNVDPGQFEQVFVNLVVNARDAMPIGGRLVVMTANVELDEDYCRARLNVRPGKYVMLSIRDTGQGMSQDVQKHLFEPFFTTKPRGRGTGLGLATIYSIVVQAGGSIEVGSTEGKGTTFKIFLPMAAEKPDGTNQEQDTRDIKGGNETILLVEDEQIVRNMTEKSLKRLGYRVFSVENGEAALTLAAELTGRIDLLVTDVIMPGLNGRQLAESLKQFHPETAVLFMSGYTDDILSDHDLDGEAPQFIGKPFTPLSIAAKIRRVLDV